MYGQFRKTSKKAQAMFIGRAIQLLTESIEQYREEKKLRMDTLHFIVTDCPLRSDEGEEVKGWILIEVRYEVGSMDPYTEEDRKKDAERLQEAREWKVQEEKEYGEAAMEALEEERRRIYPMKTDGRIQ
jgi:hypothetical protein